MIGRQYWLCALKLIFFIAGGEKFNILTEYALISISKLYRVEFPEHILEFSAALSSNKSI